jgi:hypothetical protein
MAGSLSEEVLQRYDQAEEGAGQARATRNEKLRADYPSPCTGLVEAGRSDELWQRLKAIHQ